MVAVATVVALAAGLGGLQRAHAALDWTSAKNSPGFTGTDKVKGVNLGGWFILENWMTSDLFGVSPLDESDVPDEWNYCNILGKAECLSRLEEHWSTYITEEDFKLIQAAGLNTVRIPIGYWAFDLNDEPYVQGQIKHLGDALTWAKTYNIDVMVDLHGLPGSQNGQDNSGLKGNITWASNSSNIDRSINALELLTVEVTKESYGGVVKAIEVINEPYLDTMMAGGATFDQLADYYVRAYNSVRAKETVIASAAPVMVVIHDAFQPVLNWEYFFGNESLGGNWTNFALDIHLYEAFNGQDAETQEQHMASMCAKTADIVQASKNYTIIVGEFSLGTQTYCVEYKTCFNVTMEDNFKTDAANSTFNEEFWEVQRGVYESAGGWIFWNWKTDAAATWSFYQSQKQGWIPADLAASSWSFDANASTNCLVAKSDVATPTFPSTFVGSTESAASNSSSSAAVGAASASTSSRSEWTVASLLAIVALLVSVGF